jgi:exosortase/archaeosortase family protein
LALLSLPSLASLQFFLGYPARVASAEAARWLLGAQGFPVQRQGAELVCGARHLLVDAPCSGLGMLWMTLFFGMGLAAVRRTGWVATARLTAVAVSAALAANVLRLTGLFATELVLGRPDLHSSIGVASFLLGIALVGWAAPPAVAPGTPTKVTVPVRLALAVALLGLLPAPTPRAPAFPGWPATWEGQRLSLREEVTVPGFPGRIGRFTVGSDVLLLRWVARPTRLLHSSLDCLRGAQGGSADFSWQGWHGREVIRDARGQEFTDVSQWFWAASLGQSEGPWLATTRLRR